MKKTKDFLSTNRKPVAIAIVSIGILAPILTGYYVWNRDYRPVAMVNGEKILRSDLEREKQIAEKTASYIGGNKSKAEEAAKNALIQRKILDMLSGEKNVSVSETEVRARIDEIAKDYDNNPDALFDIYGKSFGYQNNELEEAVRYVILKDKLEGLVLKYKSGRYVYARYASGNDQAETELIDGKNMADWAKARAEIFKKDLDGGKSFNQLYQEAQNDPKYSYPLLYGAEFLNVGNSSEEMAASEKEAILSTEKGKYSDIVKSDSVYAIYFVDSEGTGKYASWDALFSEYQAKYVRYGILSQRQIDVAVSLYNGLVTVANKTFGTKIALAKCALCDGCHGATVKGTVMDSVTGVLLPGVSIKIWTDSQGTPCTGYDDPAGRCGPKSGTDSSDSKGYYQFGRTDKLACFVNCAYVLNKNNAKVYHWYIEATKTGFQKFGPVEVNPTNGGVLTFNIKLKLYKNTATLKVLKKGTGTGSVISNPSNLGIDCGSDCAQDFDAAAKKSVTLKAMADPGSVFAGWSGGWCSGTGACTVTMDSDKTVIANFNLLTVPVGSGSCNLSVSPTSGEHPLTVDISAVWTPPVDYNYHDHPYSCGTAENPKTCHDWQWEWDYTSTPTWYRVYWEDSSGSTGTISEGGDKNGTSGIAAPTKFSYTFPKALPVGETYTVKADFNYYAKGTHAPSKVVETPVCDLVTGIKSRDSQGSTTIEIAP